MHPDLDALTLRKGEKSHCLYSLNLKWHKNASNIGTLLEVRRDACRLNDRNLQWNQRGKGLRSGVSFAPILKK